MMRVLIVIITLFVTQLMANSYLDSIIQLYKKELKEKPNSVELKDKLAFVYFSNKEYKKAIELYKELLDKTDDSKYYKKIAFSYLKSLNPQKAKEYFLKSLNSRKDRYTTALAYANIFFKLGYSKEAIEFYKIALSIKKEYKTYLQLAYCYNDITKYDDAIYNLKEALKIKPNSYKSKDTLLFSYFLKGDRNNTLRVLKEIESKRIDNPSTYASEIFIYSKLKLYDKALKLAKEELKKYKNDYTYMDIIDIYLAQKRYKEALLLMGELSRKNYYEFAYIYNFITKNYDNAKKYLDILIKLEPNNFTNYLNLMEFELISRGKITDKTKIRVKELIKIESNRVKYNMLLLFEEISKGKEIDLDKLKRWKEANINGYGSIVFWDFVGIKEWIKSFKNNEIKSNLELAVNFFEGKIR